MNSLLKKITIAEFYIKTLETKYKPQNIFVFWSGGKDSTVALHIIKNMYNYIPFPVVFKDSTLEFPEVYDFVKTISLKWNINLIWDTLPQKIVNKINSVPTIELKRKILNKEKDILARRINADGDCKCIINGIRWFEHFHSINAFFRKKGDITFLYPILHFTERDIWDYTHMFNMPYISLYNQGYNHF